MHGALKLDKECDDGDDVPSVQEEQVCWPVIGGPLRVSLPFYRSYVVHLYCYVANIDPAMYASIFDACNISSIEGLRDFRYVWLGGHEL